MLATVVLLCAAAAGEGPVVLQRHEGPLAKAVAEAKEKGKTVLVDFTTDT